jgi:hypothetical protein
MPWLRVKNLTLDLIAFDGVLGIVLPDSTRTIFVRVAEVEALRTSLVLLQEQHKIEFNVFNTPEIEDDDAEYVTLADIKRFIAEAISAVPGASGASGIFILRPMATTVYPDNIVFADWATLYTRLVASGGGIVIIDDSLDPGSAIHIPSGTYDLRGVFIQGLGSSQPTVIFDNGVAIIGRTLRIQNINLLCDTSGDLVSVVGVSNGLVHLIHSKVTMLSTGHLLSKLSGSTGLAEIVLENSIINAATSSGHPVYSGTGEIVQLSATKCSRVFPNSLSGSGDIDAVRDLNSVVSRTHGLLFGQLTLTLCTAASRKYGIPLLGLRNSINKVFLVPDVFVHDLILGETIVVHHNGRRLKQATTGTPSEGGEYYPFESGGPGTGYDSVYLLGFTPNQFSEIEADYLLA